MQVCMYLPLADTNSMLDIYKTLKFAELVELVGLEQKMLHIHKFTCTMYAQTQT